VVSTGLSTLFLLIPVVLAVAAGVLVAMLEIRSVSRAATPPAASAPEVFESNQRAA
jgi:hypothetical protein